MKDGIARLTWVTATFNDRGLHRVMSEAVYGNIGSWDFYQKPVYLSLAFFVLALFVAVPKDRARRMIWKHGRRLRGPELVTTAELNEKLGKSKGMRVHLPDGVSFINEEIGWWDKTFHKSLSRWARVPRDREAMHFLIVGDSGTGKSVAIRQLLSQIWERGVLAERWRVHYNTIRPHSSLDYRPPAPETWLTNNMGCGEVETATRFPLPHTPDGGYLNSEGAALHNSSNGIKDRALHLARSLRRRYLELMISRAINTSIDLRIESLRDLEGLHTMNYQLRRAVTLSFRPPALVAVTL